MESIWQKTADAPSFPSLEGDKKCDVLVIGGGLAGLLTAHRLTREGVRCVLVEADRICSHTTGNTTAKLTLQHGLIYNRIISRYGVEHARAYLMANEAAIEDYRALSAEYDFDFKQRSAYVYTTDDVASLEREAAAYLRLGYAAQLVEHTELPIATAMALRLDNQASIHPLKLCYALARELEIYEGTRVRELARGEAVCDCGRIRAEKIIVATHFPILNKHGLYFLKQYQKRSYVLALEGVGEMKGMYIDGSGDGLSFRSMGDTLLLGGGGHRTGARSSGWKTLEDFAEKHYTGAHIVAKYATQDCITLDGIPYIGRYSASTDGIYVATGFNKWGMSSSMVAASILTDAVLGRKSPYAETFSPSRSILHLSTLGNIFHSVKGLLTPTVPRCPHLGCALKYNRAEHSWDCPCHGSRFTEKGKLLDTPATGDLPAKKNK